MKALISSTLSGSGVSDDLAQRVQLFHARLSGKSKVDAQIDYLSSLRTFCPFYGSTFYDVYCQYDDNPLENEKTPPTISMIAAVGPVAITLMTKTDPPVFMQHAYKRVIKWISYADKHIFTYWVIKPDVSLLDIEEYQEEGINSLDTKRFCDCVYLVTSQVRELEYLVKSYVEGLANISPSLPGASEELLPPTRTPSESFTPIPNHTKAEKPQTKVSRIGLFFNALGSGSIAHNDSEGSGLNSSNNEEEAFGDDTAGVSGSLFQTVYKRMGSKRSTQTGDVNNGKETNADVNSIPPSIQYAASMSELKRMAEEQNFSDSAEEDDDNDDDDEDDEEKDSKTSSSEINENTPSTVPKGAFKRASRILFGSFGAAKSKNELNEDD